MASWGAPDLSFNLGPLRDLDQICLARVATMDPSPMWFFYFRVAKNGVSNRTLGIVEHYNAVHAAADWAVIEWQLSSLLYHLVSEYECLVFMANTLGYSVSPELFLDPSDGVEVRSIGPSNMWGQKKIRGKDVGAGYRVKFPLFVGVCDRARELNATFEANHNVAKHRTAIFSGGRRHPQAPAESLGPMAEIHLNPQANLPFTERSGTEVSLEASCVAFARFVTEALAALLDDFSALS